MSLTQTKTNLARCLAVFAVVTLAASTHAQTVLYQDATDAGDPLASGIQNLRLNNRCYDVEFVDGTYLSTYFGGTPTFLGQADNASSAANAIRDILNAESSVPEINDSNNEVIWVPHDRISRLRFRASQVGHDQSTDPWQRYADFQGQVGVDFLPWEFARFTEGPDVVYADNTGYAVGINNLNIDGTCIDVRFADGSYLDVYDDHSPRYLGNELRANYAANMIMNLLNAEANVPQINDSDNEVLWIPTDRPSRGSFEAEQLGHNQSANPWQRFGDFLGSVGTDYVPWDFVVFDESLDCNRDGVVDVDDMNCACADPDLAEGILNSIGSVLGDLNGNGVVGFADFLRLSNNMGETGSYTDGDINCDGEVGFADFLILSNNYGLGGPIIIDDLKAIDHDMITIKGTGFAEAVPEPSASTLAAGLLPVLLLFRRRRG